MKRIPSLLICTALAAPLAACNSAALTDATQKPTTAADASSVTAETKLTDDAAQESTDAATETAKANDAAGDASAAEGQRDLPEFMKAVQAARDYTRQLLGIDDTALKNFKAKVAAVRALSNSPEEFKDNIAVAEDEFQTAMDAQKAAADKAREEHAVELKAVFDGTVAVFVACGTDVALGEHKKGDNRRAGKRGPGGKGGPGERGHQEHGGKGPLPEDGGRGGVASGARMVFGSGEFQGDLKEMRQHFRKLGGMGLADDASASAECKAASDALLAVIQGAESPDATAAD